MDKIKKVENYIKKGESFLGKNLTSDNSEFEAWNNSLMRFIEKQYGKESTIFKTLNNRAYSLHFCTLSTPEKEFVEAFEQDLHTTLADLQYIKEEIEEDEITIEEEPKRVKTDNNSPKELQQPIIINNNIYNNISNINEIKSNIENNSNINNAEKKELIEQLRKLENLQKSNKSKNEKWIIVKNILSFVIDKGADIAIMYLPQIWKALQ